MTIEQKIRSNLIGERIGFVFLALVYTVIAGGCIYLILRSQAYRYEIFWYVSMGELFLLFLIIKLPNRVVFSVLKILILIMAFLGPLYISMLDPGYRPAIYSLFVQILALLIVNSPAFFRSSLDKIRKLEMQLNRIKTGLPLEDETISEMGEDESIEMARQFYTFVKRTYSIKGNEELTVLDNFISLFHVVPFTTEIAKLGGFYKRDFGKSHGVGLADAILAATAQVERAVLKTLNVKHYPMFKALKPAYRK